jgi:hypothetical protein
VFLSFGISVNPLGSVRRHEVPLEERDSFRRMGPKAKAFWRAQYDGISALKSQGLFNNGLIVIPQQDV